MVVSCSLFVPDGYYGAEFDGPVGRVEAGAQADEDGKSYGKGCQPDGDDRNAWGRACLHPALHISCRDLVDNAGSKVAENKAQDPPD